MTSAQQKYIKNGHLLVSANEAILLGYKLNLTKTEHLILKALAESSSPLSAEEVTDKIAIDLSKGNVSFHIYNINSKAKCVSNRILIKNIAKIGYFLNEEM